MKKQIKALLRRVGSVALYPLLENQQLILQLLRTPKASVPDVATQIGLSLHYKGLAQSGGTLPSFREVGFKVFSQTDEDGVLLFIFSLIGVTNRKCVEICAGNGIECNTANLILNHYWTGLMFDGDSEQVKHGQEFYRSHPAVLVYPPRFQHAWITRDNVNSLVKENGYEGEIDLLSLDLDGVDYWIWEALNVITPRVVVLEYHGILGPDRACTVPYRDDFQMTEYTTAIGMPHSFGAHDFFGASLPAFVKLGKRKGYRLVGCNVYGYNAFFVRQGIGEQLLPEIPVADCFTHPFVISAMKERFPAVRDLPWVDV
jgi:hypothetical protein